MATTADYINKQAWNALTRSWDRAQKQGKQVKVDIQILYAPVGDRIPVALDVRSTSEDLTYHHIFRAANGLNVVEYDLSDVPDEMLYQTIRSLIAQAAGDNWRDATVYAEISTDDHGLIYGRVNSSRSETKPMCFETDYRMYFVLDELRRRMHKPGQEPWVKAKFVLHQDGKFEPEFEYGVRDLLSSTTSTVRPAI